MATYPTDDLIVHPESFCPLQLWKSIPKFVYIFHLFKIQNYTAIFWIFP